MLSVQKEEVSSATPPFVWARQLKMDGAAEGNLNICHETQVAKKRIRNWTGGTF